MNNYQNQKDLDAVKIFQLKSLKRDFKKLKLDLKKASHELAEIQKLINTLEEKPPW
jgi:predicted  nucleic acid-binding Zn-ribbon protein